MATSSSCATSNSSISNNPLLCYNLSMDRKTSSFALIASLVTAAVLIAVAVVFLTVYH